MQCLQSLDASAEVESDTDSEESDRHNARLRVLVDHLLSGTSRSITLLERRALRTQAAAHQDRDVLSRFMTICSESSLLLKKPSAGRPCGTYSNQLYMDGEQHQVGTQIIASLMHHFPEYSRTGTHRLPRTARARKVWRHLIPGQKARHICWSCGKLWQWI